MNIRDIKTKQDIIDFELSLYRRTAVFTPEEDEVILAVAYAYCYDDNGWRDNDPSADDISDQQLSIVLWRIASLPPAEEVSFREQIAA
jgi:hypothetical protein